MPEFAFAAELWRWRPQESWHFVTVPEELADVIRLSSGPPRAFGSVRVEATIGDTRWQTSVFPDRRRGTYLLPVKRSVRSAEDLDVDDVVQVSIRILDR